MRIGQSLSRRHKSATDWGILIVTVLLFLLAPQAALANSSPNTSTSGIPPPLSISASMVQAQLAPGESPAVQVTLTNQGEACTIVASPTFGLEITSLKQNGERVHPSLAPAKFLDGYGAALRASLMTLAPGDSVTMIWTAEEGRGGVDNFSFESIDSIENQTASLLWPVAPDGEVDLGVAYRSTHEASCAASSEPVNLSFKFSQPVGKPAEISKPIWVIVAGAAIIIVTLVLFLIRHRKARILLIIPLLAAAAVSLEAIPAEARIRPLSGTMGAYQECTGKFTSSGGDPDGIFKNISESTDETVDLLPGKGFEQHYRPGIKKNYGTIKWDIRPPSEQIKFSDGVQADRCASLYHELAHRDQGKNGRDDGRNCVASTLQGPKDTGIPVDEVEATWAENRYRASQGLPPRTKYAGNDLPAGPCQPPAPAPTKCQGDGGCGGVVGDPHMRTGDGHAYDFQGSGEFDTVLDPQEPEDMRLQTRMVAYEDSRVVSVVSAVALNVSGTRLGFYGSTKSDTPLVRRDGEAWNVLEGATPLPNGASIEWRGGSDFIVHWPDGTQIVVGSRSWGFDVSVAVSQDRRGRLVGLLGNFDGNLENDLMTRGGENVGRAPAFDVLYRSFGDSWRVPADQSLFDYAPGESSHTFTDKSFPDRDIRAADLPEREGAKDLCQSAGVSDPRFLEDCILDVTLTGNLEFATAAALGQHSIANYKFQLVTMTGPDFVGRGDGQLEPDGADDAVFQVVLQGDIADLIMTVCRPEGTPGASHWDTFTGSRTIPSGYSYSTGSQTWMLGIYAEGRQLNNDDGSIALSMNQASPLTIHVQNDSSLVKGAHVCLDVLTIDGSSVRLLTKLP